MPASVGSTDAEGAEKLSALESLRIESVACSGIHCADAAMDSICDGYTLLRKKGMIDKIMCLVEMKWLSLEN